MRERIDQVSIGRAPLRIRVSGRLGTPLWLSVQTPEASFDVRSESRLTPRGGKGDDGQLTREMFLERLKALDRTAYFLEGLDLDDLHPDLFLPFREITAMRGKMLLRLRGSQSSQSAQGVRGAQGSQTPVAPIEVPALPPKRRVPGPATLAVLISSPRDLGLRHETRAEIYYQLPSGLSGGGDTGGGGEAAGDGVDGEQLVDLFRSHRELVPWFPPVLIGEDYAAAVDVLDRARPRRVVANNTGVAFQAWRRGIPWIAGPDLNTANSYTLQGLKERFDCVGAFLSNELSRDQIRRIRAPEGFELYYRLFHPIVLLTSRQCLLHQVTGCDKERVDDACLRQCDRSASITNARQVSLLIRKTPGHFARIFHETHFLNPSVVTDVPDTFSGYLVDLTDIETETRLDGSKASVLQLFEELIAGSPGAAERAHQRLHPTTNMPYGRGM